jgi:hypothetical protein
MLTSLARVEPESWTTCRYEHQYDFGTRRYPLLTYHMVQKYPLVSRHLQCFGSPPAQGVEGYSHQSVDEPSSVEQRLVAGVFTSIEETHIYSLGASTARK